MSGPLAEQKVVSGVNGHSSYKNIAPPAPDHERRGNCPDPGEHLHVRAWRKLFRFSFRWAGGRFRQDSLPEKDLLKEEGHESHPQLHKQVHAHIHPNLPPIYMGFG